jgi:hypothetical protein
MRYANIFKTITLALVCGKAFAGLSWTTVQPVILVGSEECTSGPGVHYFTLKNETYTTNTTTGATAPRAFYFYDNVGLKNDWLTKLATAKVSGLKVQVLFSNDSSTPGCALNPGFKVSGVQLMD